MCITNEITEKRPRVARSCLFRCTAHVLTVRSYTHTRAFSDLMASLCAAAVLLTE